MPRTSNNMKTLNEAASTVSSMYRKGHIVKQLDPFFVLSLEAEDDWIHQLPQYPVVRDHGDNHLCQRNQQFLKEHPYIILLTQAVVMCLELLKSKSGADGWKATTNISSCDGNLGLSNEEQELLVEAFPIIPQDVTIEWPDWVSLYCRVKRDLRILCVSKCAVEYATRTVFRLSHEELKEACHLVRKKTAISKLSSKFSLSQALQDVRCTLLVLLFDPFCDATRIRHSCLPNTLLEYNPENQTVDQVALYDIRSNEELTESMSLVDSASTCAPNGLARKVWSRLHLHVYQV